MSRCATCGHDNQAGAKFCSECGTPMAPASAVAREERKVVTVLFADLVGFTSRSEKLDPEDVRALLNPYYSRLRTELERFGGTVEKFIGDAVMALFGAPIAHEDDPERAVRAALAIRDWVLEQPEDLQLRIAVNTGEALVALGARPAQGEGMASGDVVNTTARLQTAAPVNGILVGETTYRATAQTISYRPTEPVTAKGKAELVPAWEALEARSRFGVDLAPASRSPMIGRVHESRVLVDALERAQRERASQLVTLVGVPGIGKSRLVAELFTHVDTDPTQVVLWRQGRSLPYGDGVTFWALTEMVKAQAGILETDDRYAAEAKIEAAVASLIADPAEAKWVAGHLGPLAGVAGSAEPSGERRDEAFTAWRRFFEALAEQNPLVLIFEDLHWADDNLLDFVEHLVDWAIGVPMLVVCNSRPELFERRPGWAASTRNAVRLSLAPLSDDETAQLISNLSERPVMPADTQQALLARAGGNPLYAEQYVRMLEERKDGESLPLPETIQGIIAARLDALSVDEKCLLQDASVFGKVFWLGAVSAGSDRRTAEQRLHALERKDFVQRARRSSVADEAEYAFMHVLVRDVAYGQIPRGERAEKHRTAARWMATLGRPEDHAEMVAHHYMNALDLRRVSGQAVDAAFRAEALTSLRDAGERAASLNADAAAAGFFESAIELAEPGSIDRARLLFRLGQSRHRAGASDPVVLAEASADLLSCGDPETAAEAECVLSELEWLRGDADESMRHLNRARALVDDRESSRVKALVMSTVSRYLMLTGRSDESIRIGREAAAMAEFFGLEAVRANALDNIGAARCHSGDPAGIDDLEEAIVLAEHANAPAEFCRARANLASVLWLRGNLERSAVIRAEAQSLASRFGQNLLLRWLRGAAALEQYVRGEWSEAQRSVDEFIGEVEAGSPHYLAGDCYMVRAHLRLGRDDAQGARSDAEKGVDFARLAKDPQMLYPAFARAADVFSELGDHERAGALVDELLDQLRVNTNSKSFVLHSVHTLAWTLSGLGRNADLDDVLPQDDVPWVHAARAFLAGDVRHAADTCRAMGALAEEARDRLWLAKSLFDQHRRVEADTELQRALVFYRSVDATRYIREGEAMQTARVASSG